MDSIKKSSHQFEDEEFKSFETKVDSVMKILEQLNNTDKEEQESGMIAADQYLNGKIKDLEKLNEDNFIVNVKSDRTVINRKALEDDEDRGPKTMSQYTFMKQLEDDAKKRAANKKERESIAQNFRKMGNEAFRKQEYEKAVNLYTKAIDHVKDSPILYNNRALCYIKLKLNKRAVIDCDFVINKIDEKNLRAWLYRAAAYFKQDDMKNFENCVKLVKKNNPKELEYIEEFVEKIRKEQF